MTRQARGRPPLAARQPGLDPHHVHVPFSDRRSVTSRTGSACPGSASAVGGADGTELAPLRP
ncbi:hypothetical protein ACG33_05680 [Steroidobacter denitrificans]|uniref:Uncharacterized protein n=1 Tax=Steroidobacter denitrificans TaxID=465721 RepID=A0A127FAH1_STEDE|nr:hypothetical protein ACG33_05680 [Steroidobacter denitrificans]